MSPNGGGEPTGKLLELINKTWGSFATFKTKFTEEASNHFGSGWAWLVRDAENNVRLHKNRRSVLFAHCLPLLTSLCNYVITLALN